MEIKQTSEYVPDFLLEAQKIHPKMQVSGLTIQEFVNLLKSCLFSALNELQKPAEFTPIYYSREECAKLLKISIVTLDSMLKSGELKSSRIGKKPIILKSQVEDYLKS